MQKLLKWIVVLAAVLNYSFMAFDGSRGLIIGDYTRPESGEYAGRLGPWSDVVSAVGINPESTFMKTTFLLWGIFGLIIAVSYAMEVRSSAKVLLVLSILTTWYLVPGTVLSLLQFVLLLILNKKITKP